MSSLSAFLVCHSINWTSKFHRLLIFHGLKMTYVILLRLVRWLVAVFSELISLCNTLDPFASKEKLLWYCRINDDKIMHVPY